MNKQNNGMKNGLYYVFVVLGMILLTYFIFGPNSGQSPDIEYSTFSQQLKDKQIEKITIQPVNGTYKITGEYKEKQEVNSNGLLLFGSTKIKTTKFSTIILPNDSTLASINKLAGKADTKVSIKQESNSGLWISLLASIVPLIILVGFFYMMMGQGGQGGGNGRVMNFGKSKAKEIDKKK